MLKPEIRKMIPANKKYEDMGIKCWGKEYIAAGREQTHLLLNGGIYHVPVDKIHLKPGKFAKAKVSKGDRQCGNCGKVYAYQIEDKRGKIFKSAKCKFHDEGNCLLTKYGNFLKNIGDDIDKGVVNYICEQRTPVFRMHTDLDILQSPDEELTVEILHTWVTEMQYVMNEFFGKVDDYIPLVSDTSVASSSTYLRLAAVVCLAPSKNVEKNKKIWTKTGVHIVWPYIFTNAKNAQTIRLGWLQHFEKKFGLRDTNNPWQDLFDLSVYTTNGLRMVGSDKMEKCPSCKGKKAKDFVCANGICNGIEGKYSEGRVYRVVFAVQPISTYNDNTYVANMYDKMLNEIKKSGFSEVLFTSIRTAKKDVTKLKMPDWYDPKYFSDEEEKHRSIFNPTPTERKKKRELIERMPENQESFKRLLSKKHKMVADEKECAVVQTWLRDTNLPPAAKIPDVYRNTKIIDMIRLMGDDGYPFYFVRVDSSFCMNIRDEHNHNSIYFLINRHGLYQKCFCSCDTTEGRAFGLCKKYKSGLYYMPNYVISMLYPMIASQNMELDLVAATHDLSRLDEVMDREAQLQLLQYKADELELRYQHLATQKQSSYEKRFHSKRD